MDKEANQLLADNTVGGEARAVICGERRRMRRKGSSRRARASLPPAPL